MGIPPIPCYQIASSLRDALGADVKAVSILDRFFYSREYKHIDAALDADRWYEQQPDPVHVLEVPALGKRLKSNVRDVHGDVYHLFYIDIYLHVDRDWELSKNGARYGRHITGPTIDAMMNILPEEVVAIYGLGCHLVGGVFTAMYGDALMFLKPIIECRRGMVHRHKSATVFLTRRGAGLPLVNIAFFGFLDFAKSESMFADSVSDLMRRYRSQLSLSRACTEIVETLQLPLRVIHGKFEWLWKAPDLVELQSADLGAPIAHVAEERLLQAGQGEAVAEVRFLHVRDSADLTNTVFCVVESLDGAGNLVAVSLFHPLMDDDDEFAENMRAAIAGRNELPQKQTERVLYLDNEGDSHVIDQEMVRIIPLLAKVRPLDLRD